MSSTSTARTVRRLADEVAETVNNHVDALHSQATPTLVRAAEQADALLARGADTMRESAAQVRLKAAQATDRTADYIRAQPVKSVLIAAAGGAALMALTQMALRRRDER